MSPAQRFRLIVMTSSLALVFLLFGYGAYQAYGLDPFMLTVVGVVMLFTVAVAVFTLRRTARLEREGGQALVQSRAVRIILWCAGIACLLKLASAFIEGLAA